MEKISHLVENAFRIAWDYLEQTSQIDDPEFTSWLLLDCRAYGQLRGETQAGFVERRHHD